MGPVFLPPCPVAMPTPLVVDAATAQSSEMEKKTEFIKGERLRVILWVWWWGMCECSLYIIPSGTMMVTDPDVTVVLLCWEEKEME